MLASSASVSGSIPFETVKIKWLQGVTGFAYWTVNPEVTGSSPVGVA
jgi:hypothetical protein